MMKPLLKLLISAILLLFYVSCDAQVFSNEFDDMMYNQAVISKMRIRSSTMKLKTEGKKKKSGSDWYFESKFDIKGRLQLLIMIFTNARTKKILRDTSFYNEPGILDCAHYEDLNPKSYLCNARGKIVYWEDFSHASLYQYDSITSKILKIYTRTHKMHYPTSYECKVYNYNHRGLLDRISEYERIPGTEVPHDSILILPAVNYRMIRDFQMEYTATGRMKRAQETSVQNALKVMSEYKIEYGANGLINKVSRKDSSQGTSHIYYFQYKK